MVAILAGIIFVVLALLFAFLATRARRAKSAVVRLPVAILAGVLALLFGVVGVVDWRGVYVLSAARANPVSALKADTSAAALERGQRLAHICAGCHSSAGDLPLDGGRFSMLANPDGSGLGDLYAPNLTPGGPLKDWSDGEVVRAIREGVAQDGHALIIMPSGSFRELSDADVAAIVGYLRSEPAVTRTTPPRQLNLIGTMLVGAGLFPTEAQPPLNGPVPPPDAGVTPQHGRYLVDTSSCQSCHGADLAGGIPGRGGPVGPNLTLIVPRWTEAQFVQTIRTGKDPSGHSLRSDIMPWKNLSAAFSDDELKAMYAYLRGLQPIQR